ncbi:MAG: thioredoxin family protein [Micrococcales bacterium]|nr:thioredoxin family protein [Micrococcales bacterium]
MIPTIDNNTLNDTLSLSGPVLLDFWHEACASCRALEPRMERFAREHPDVFRAYGIDADASIGLADRLTVG